MSESFRRGHLVLQPDVGRVSWKGVEVVIASNVDRYVPYRELYDGIHYEGFMAGSGEHGYRANVRSSIKRIRNKFRQCDPTFNEIRNCTGFGYCWGKSSQ
jgi:two-component system response regulator ChvI